MPQRWHLEWPEKATFLVVLIAATPVFLFWLFLCAGLRTPFDFQLDVDIARWLGEIEFFVALPVWLVLRGGAFAIACGRGIGRRISQRMNACAQRPRLAHTH